MMMALALLCSYLIGAIPAGYLFGKLVKGIDIRNYGSGNIGATNAMRVLGKVPGSIVLLLDITKGVVAITLVGDLFGLDRILARVLLGVAVVVGHNWTVFLQFKGGKGIATSLGVLIGLTVSFPVLRPVLLICLGTWAVVFLASGYVSLASLVASVMLPVAMALTGQSSELIWLGVIFAVFVIFRHRSNIARLRAGTESRAKLPYLKH